MKWSKERWCKQINVHKDQMVRFTVGLKVTEVYVLDKNTLSIFSFCLGLSMWKENIFLHPLGDLKIHPLNLLCLHLHQKFSIEEQILTSKVVTCSVQFNSLRLLGWCYPGLTVQESDTYNTDKTSFKDSAHVPFCHFRQMLIWA